MYKENIINQLEPLKIYNLEPDQEGNKTKVYIDIEVSAKQLDDMQNSLDTLEMQASSVTATDMGLSWREALYGQKNIDSHTIEERRANIIALEIGEENPVEDFKKSLESYGYKIDLIEYFSEYRMIVRFVDVIGIPANIQDFTKTLYKIKPPHIAVEVNFRYRTWGELEIYTWEQLETTTWENIEGGVINA